MDKFIEYAPIIIVIMLFFVQYKIFITPEQLEKKHREIIEDVELRFATRESFNDFKERFEELKDKIDKIYDKIMGG